MNYRNLLATSAIVLLGFGCNAPTEDVQEPTQELEEYDASISQQDPAESPAGSSAQQKPPIDGVPEFYNHAVYFASSDDEQNWELSDEPIALHASVPDLLVLDQDIGNMIAGTAISYFVNSAPVIDGEDENVAFITSSDNGLSWSERTVVTLDQEGFIPVDPSVIQLEDGRLRLHFFDFSAMRTPGQKGPYIFYSAISEDGVSFVIEDESLRSDSFMTDPEVISFDNVWFMYFAMHDGDDRGIWVATSEDGIHFEDQQFIEGMQGIPGAMTYQDQVHLFGCGGGVSFATSESGFTFGSPQSFLGGIGLVCDPSPAVLSDGTFGLVVKRIEQE